MARIAVIYRTVAWSLGGFSIKGSCSMLKGFEIGDEVIGTFGLPGSLPGHKFSAVVIRTSNLYLDGLKMLENVSSRTRTGSSVAALARSRGALTAAGPA